MKAIKVQCENVFKTNDNTMRIEAFTDKWIMFVNSTIKNNGIIRK